MEAQNIMTRNVVSVGPEASVGEIAKLLVEHQVSAVPVVDSEFGLLGIVSERDLVRRPEIAGEERPPWWLAVRSDPAERAKDYVKTHAQCAGEIMTRKVVTVSEATPLAVLLPCA